MTQQYKNDNLKVIKNKILVKKLSQQKFGSLLLIDSASDSYCKGLVCGLGEGIKDDKGNITLFSVKIGDEILFPKYKGYEVRLNDENYVILTEEEIIAIILPKA